MGSQAPDSLFVLMGGLMPMNSPTALREETGTAPAPVPGSGTRTLRPHHFLVLSLWCGLVTGPLEVGAIVLHKQTVDIIQFYWMSRHFVWLIPLTNLLIFLVLGLVLALVILVWPRSGSGLAARLLCTLTLLPLFWTVFPRIYGLAGFILVLGVAAWLVPALQQHAAGFRRCVGLSFPILAVLIPLLAASVWTGDRLKEWREQARPLPAPGSPNVLLIVLDTVAADHLSIHGYSRPTCPTLEGLAQRGIRFDRAQASSSWTLPSHASFFTGRWPHELSAGWFTPLDATHPRWRSISRLGAMPRPGSSRTCPIAAPTRGCNAASRATRTTSSQVSAPSSPRRWSTGRWRG